MKPKSKWNVYFEVTYGYNDRMQGRREYAGETYAISQAQAENNMNFRYGKCAGEYEMWANGWCSKRFHAVKAPETLSCGDWDQQFGEAHSFAELAEI